MSALEVLQSFQAQCNALLSALGMIDPYDSHLMVFYLDKEIP